jgi:endonuclease YncB( thermonuclease family)
MKDTSLYFYACKLTRVIDGDSIVADIDLGFNTFTNRHIRLWGIDTPEIRTRDLEEKERGFVSKARVDELMESCKGEFILESRGLDKFGRSLGIIWIQLPNENINLNETLVTEGLAVEYMR